MKRSAFGRDRGLSTRLFLTMFLLGALYVVFFVVLLQLFNLSYFAIIVIMGRLAFLQFFTSGQDRARGVGARSCRARRRPSSTRWSSGSRPWATCRCRGSLSSPPTFERLRDRSEPEVCRRRHRGLWDRLRPREIEGVLAHG